MSARRGGWRGRGMRDVSGREKQPMQYIPSVSRSSGIDKDGDALKSHRVQEEYRQFIQGKLDDITISESETEPEPEPESDRKARMDSHENVMILFRKLREGIYASKRADAFALEVYETSFYLSVIFNLPRHIASITPHLFSCLYVAHPRAPNQEISLALYLLHNLVAGFPSQLAYRQTWADIPSILHSPKAPAVIWLKHVSKSLRTCNYASFERLTRPSSLPACGDCHPPSMPHRAFVILTNTLRTRARQRHWTIIRTGYRELALQLQSESRIWLSRSLTLPPEDVDSWIEAKGILGHVRRKEGVQGRWIVLKP